jgi:hypothetical protein
VRYLRHHPPSPVNRRVISRSAPAAIDIRRRDEVSGYPPLKYEALRVAALQGLDIARSNHFSSLWAYIVHDVIRGVVLDLHLPVARSAGGFLQPGTGSHSQRYSDNLLRARLDWTGKLQEGEIVFIPAEGVIDPDTGFVLTAVVGDVIVVRIVLAMLLDQSLILCRLVDILPSSQQICGRFVIEKLPSITS